MQNTLSTHEDDTDTTTFEPRGPLSSALLRLLQDAPPETGSDADDGLRAFVADADTVAAASDDLLRDEDVQLTLFVLYGIHYGDVVERDDEWEWNPALVAARLAIEKHFEATLRAVVPVPEHAALEPRAQAVADLLFQVTGEEGGPSLSRYIASKATREQLTELIVQRSIYTLKEADPHSWGIPRLSGRPKAALVEIQSDEYGGGRPERVHASIFAATMRALGLDDTYGRYVDNVPAITLASLNQMSMFGLNRRLRGAVVGHLAAFEMTSSIPNGLYARGFRRNGFGDDVTDYFDEHVEADAVHEQIAGRNLAGALAEDHPELLPDILFGAAACLAVDGWAAEHLYESWTAGRTSLRTPLPHAG
jgi:hypothetical protein